MKKGKWETTICSDVAYEHLVAEVTFDEQFLLLLDREEGRDSIHITLPKKNGELGVRILLVEFLENLRLAEANLCR